MALRIYRALLTANPPRSSEHTTHLRKWHHFFMSTLTACTLSSFSQGCVEAVNIQAVCVSKYMWPIHESAYVILVCGSQRKQVQCVYQDTMIDLFQRHRQDVKIQQCNIKIGSSPDSWSSIQTFTCTACMLRG